MSPCKQNRYLPSCLAQKLGSFPWLFLITHFQSSPEILISSCQIYFCLFIIIATSQSRQPLLAYCSCFSPIHSSFSIQNERPKRQLYREPASKWGPSLFFQIQMEKVNTRLLSIWAYKAGAKGQRSEHSDFSRNCCLRLSKDSWGQRRGRLWECFLKKSDAHSGPWRNDGEAEQVVWDWPHVSPCS